MRETQMVSEFSDRVDTKASNEQSSSSPALIPNLEIPITTTATDKEQLIKI
jgi:hypothetical protein